MIQVVLFLLDLTTVVEDRHFFPDESSATGQSPKETPVVYVRDLCSFVTDLLDKYSD